MDRVGEGIRCLRLHMPEDKSSLAMLLRPALFWHRRSHRLEGSPVSFLFFFPFDWFDAAGGKVCETNWGWQ